jgi:hypothetical protein
MPDMTKKVNWNSLLITVGFGLLSYFGDKLNGKVEQTHDDVIAIKAQLVPRAEYDIQIAEIKSRILMLEADLTKMKQGTK